MNLSSKYLGILEYLSMQMRHSQYAKLQAVISIHPENAFPLSKVHTQPWLTLDKVQVHQLFH